MNTQIDDQTKTDSTEAQKRAGVVLGALPGSPLIECRFDCVTGGFDMRTGKMVAVKHRKYGSVDLCFAEGWNIPFAQIKLHDRDLARDADAVFDAACRLGDEICRRWNASAENVQDHASDGA